MQNYIELFYPSPRRFSQNATTADNNKKQFVTQSTSQDMNLLFPFPENHFTGAQLSRARSSSMNSKSPNRTHT
jgi:hypothetical protein